jgi:hypothetical protein
LALNVHELEETISRLESVDAVRIVVQGSDVTEVHVLAATTKPPKQVVRDVQSVAMARYGTAIDRRVISVVQLDGGTATAKVSPERPALVKVVEEPQGSRTSVNVVLAYQGVEHTGSAIGPAATAARLRVVGEATLDALDRIHLGAPPLSLDAIGTATVGMRTVVIAVIVSSTHRGEEIAVGSALANGDPSEAGVKAVLDGLNRRLPEFIE